MDECLRDSHRHSVTTPFGEEDSPRPVTATSRVRSPEEAPPSSRMSGSWLGDGATLALLVTVYLAVQLAMLKPPALEGGDQLDYFTTAANLPDVTASHRHLRLGLLLPVRMAMEVFGYSEAAYYFVPIGAGVLLCASTFLLARMLFNRWVGFAAGLLVVLNPFVLWESSHLLPDLPGTALFTTGILLVTLGSLRYRPKEIDSKQAILFGLGGLFLGLSYLTREYLVILFPLALLALYIYHVPWRKSGWIVLGTLPPLMVELIWGWAVYQNPLVRIATAGGLRGTSGTGPPYATEAGEVLTILGSNFNRFASGSAFIVLLVVGVLLGSIAVASGKRKFWLPLVWTAGIWAFLTLLGLIPVFLTDGRGTFLRLQKFRYWLPVLPGLVILGFAAIDLGHQWLAKRARWAGTLGVVAMVTLAAVISYVGTDSIAGHSTYIRNGESQYAELRDYLEGAGSTHDVIYTDTGHLQALGLVLPIYTRTTFGTQIWDGEIKALGHATDFIDLEEIESGLVISRPEGYRSLVANGDQFMPPDYLLNPPSDWQPEMISQNGAIVLYSTAVEGSELVGETDAHEWRRSDGEVGSDGEIPETVLFEVDPGTTTQIIDVDGLTKSAGGSQQASVPSDTDAIWGRLQAEWEGSGRLLINCHFTVGGESLEPVRAATRGRYNAGVEHIDYRCDIPAQGTPMHVGFEVALRGPIDLTIGSHQVFLDP